MRSDCLQTVSSYRIFHFKRFPDPSSPTALMACGSAESSAQRAVSSADESAMPDSNDTGVPRLGRRRSCDSATESCPDLCRGLATSARRLSHRGLRRGRFSPMCSLPPSSAAIILSLLCLTLWPLGCIKQADAQEQVRRADYATNCGLGFAGLHCSEVVTCEELDYCSGHGLCQRGGFCICDPGWQGPACRQSNCPSQCSGHGSCAATGGCVCDAGFTGIICNQVICLGGGNCTGHGACLPGGICDCEKGYLGGACDIIDVAQKCSNHGAVKTIHREFHVCLLVAVVAAAVANKWLLLQIKLIWCLLMQVSRTKTAPASAICGTRGLTVH